MKIRPISDFLWIMIGPAIWAGHLFLLYAAETLICLSSPSQGTMLVTTMTLTGVALCALAAAAYAHRARAKTLPADERDFVPLVTMTLAGISAIAVIWTAVPGLALRVCTFQPN
jgi:hypothetical protein